MISKETTQILLNILLILVIICVYIHLSQLIKNDGMQIQIIQKQLKESMSQAQRMGLAGMYVGKKDNLLMSKERREKDKGDKGFPLISTGSRFNKPVFSSRSLSGSSNQIPVQASAPAEIANQLGADTVDIVKAGGSSAAAITAIQPVSEEVNDDYEMEPVQTAAIAPTETFVGSNNRIQPNAAFLYSSTGRPVLA
jgi:hypothetical protein